MNWRLLAKWLFMFLLDTNVISELTKPKPSPEVLAWFAATPASHIFICSVTVCELEFGLALMAKGKRRDNLLAAVRGLVRIEFEGRCLSLDAKCAELYGRLAAEQQTIARQCSTEDAMIAAIALTHQFSLVTRNTKDFAGVANLLLLDPWAHKV